MASRMRLLIFLGLLLISSKIARADDATAAPAKPAIAVFPLGGNADNDLRDQCAFALRMKIDRDGTYAAIDGPTMQDDASSAKSPITYETSVDQLRDLVVDEHPVILIWGDFSARPGEVGYLRLRAQDLRPGAKGIAPFERDVRQPTDLRFAMEDFLKTLPGLHDFAHPSEEAVHHDAASDAEWKKNPNLVVDGDFTQPGHWTALYQSEVYLVQFSGQLPEPDHVSLYRAATGESPATSLAMNLSPTAAANNGLAAISDPIPIQQGMRYRIQFRYKSDGPNLHVFVKGYTQAADLAGKPALREIYRRQVPPSGPTNGQWTTVECDMNPQHVAYPVQFLRVDLYAYLSPGAVQFADVQLKAVGRQTAADRMIDEAAKPLTTQP